MSEQIERVKLTDLQPDPLNTNAGTERGYYMLTDSIGKRGAARGIFATRDGVVMAGNKTLQAAIDEGLTEAIVVHTDGKALVVTVRDDLESTDPVARKLALEDNRVGEVSYEVDAAVLAALLEEDDTLAEGLWRDDELAELLADLTAEEAPEDAGAQVDKAAEVQEKWKVQLGDVWRMGQHFVICGDCREPEIWTCLLDAAGVEKVNGVFTSPPYAEQRKKQYGGVPVAEYVEWWDAVQANVRANLADDGSFFVNIKPHCENGQRVLYVFDLVLAMVRRWGWRFVDELCWQRVTSPGRWTNRFKNGFEPVYHFSAQECKFNPTNVLQDFKSDPSKYNTYNIQTARKDRPSGFDTTGSMKSMHFEGALPDNIINASGIHSGDHWAAFPVALPSFFIKAYSDPGDVWLDPFVGSGTTIVAAHNNGRRGLGIEVLEKYVAVTLQRYQDTTSDTPQLVGNTL